MERNGGGISLSLLAEDDWRAFRQLRLAALEESPTSFAPTLTQERAYDEEQWREIVRRGAVFVAAVDSRPVGVVAGIRRRPPGVGAMWVAPPWRGTGVGSRLIDAVVEWARSEGFDELTLWAPADDARACRFYRRQGFAETGRAKAFPGSAARAVHEMRRAIR